MVHMPLVGTGVLTMYSAGYLHEDINLSILLMLVCVAALGACTAYISIKGLFSHGPKVDTRMPGVAKKVRRQRARKAQKNAKAQQAFQNLGQTSSFLSETFSWSKLWTAVCAVPSHCRVLVTQLFGTCCEASFQYAAFIAIQHPFQLLTMLLITAALYVVLRLLTLPASRFDIRNQSHSQVSTRSAERLNMEPFIASPLPLSQTSSSASSSKPDAAAPTTAPAAPADPVAAAAAHTAACSSLAASAVGHTFDICSSWALLWDMCTSPLAVPFFCKAVCSLILPSPPASFVPVAAVQQGTYTPTAVQSAPWWHSVCIAIISFFWPLQPAHVAPSAASQQAAPISQSHFGPHFNSSGQYLTSSWRHRISGAWQVLSGSESVTTLHQENIHLNNQLEQVAASAAADKKLAVELLEDKDTDLQHLRDLVIAQTQHLDNTLAAQASDQAERLGKKDGCLRTAEAFIAALEGRLQEFAEQEPAFYTAEIAANHTEIASLRQQLAAEQQNNAAIRQIVSDLQTNLVPLQNSWYFAHFMHKLQDLVMPRFGLSSLAAGTFGAPLTSYHPSMGSYVIKLPTANSTAASFNQEAKYLAMCRHPNVVQYFGRVWDDSWAPNSIPGILIEKLSMDLDTYLTGVKQNNEVLSFKKVLSIGLQLAAGLNCIHQRGYLHGDLKPNNVGITADKNSVRVKILDFGEVKQPGHYNNYGGKPPFVMAYCPPELARDPAIYISESAEVFVFGLILAEVAGASRPWPINDKLYELTLKSLPCDAWVQFPANHRYSQEFVDVVEHCLKMDPAKRPSMKEVVLQLGALLP